jgi:hypothetical protein
MHDLSKGQCAWFAGEQGRSAFEGEAGAAAASSMALRRIIDQLVLRTNGAKSSATNGVA